MSRQVPILVFLALEDKFLLTFQIPLDNTAVLRSCQDAPIVRHPIQGSDSFLMPLQEMLLEVSLSVLGSDLVEQFSFFLQHLVFQLFRQQVVVLVYDLVLCFYFCLEALDKTTLIQGGVLA